MEVLPVIRNCGDLANLAEAASLFNYKNKEFWKNIEKAVY